MKLCCYFFTVIKNNVEISCGALTLKFPELIVGWIISDEVQLSSFALLFSELFWSRCAKDQYFLFRTFAVVVCTALYRGDSPVLLRLDAFTLLVLAAPDQDHRLCEPSIVPDDFCNTYHVRKLFCLKHMRLSASISHNAWFLGIMGQITNYRGEYSVSEIWWRKCELLMRYLCMYFYWGRNVHKLFLRGTTNKVHVHGKGILFVFSKCLQFWAFMIWVGLFGLAGKTHGFVEWRHLLSEFRGKCLNFSLPFIFFVA